MRRRNLLRLVPAPTPKFGGGPEDTKSIARRALVENFGPRTAGWLLAQHRRQLRLHGAVDFVLPEKMGKKVAEKARWFFVAMDYLRTRPGWSVAITTGGGKRTFRVRWLSRGYWAALRAGEDLRTAP